MQHRRVPNRRLQELRINAGFSQRDLARVTKVSYSTIRMAEAGFLPGPRIQFALADHFGMKPLDIWPLSQQKVPA